MSQYSDAVARHRREMTQVETEANRRMLRAYDDLWGSLDADLQGVTSQIAQAHADGEPVHMDWLRRQARYTRLMDQVESSRTQFEQTGSAIITDVHGTSIEYGAFHAAEREQILFHPNLYQPGGGADVFTGNINIPAMESLVGQTGPTSPLMGVLESHGTNATEIITRELVAGVSGKGADDIYRTIRRQLQSPVADSRLMALVRTEMMNSYRASMHQQYEQFEDEIDGWMWSAARQTRTCLACLAMDGEVFPMTQPFSQAHVNCRCSASPWPKDLYPSVRKFLQQQGSGEDYVRSLPLATQRKMFPSADSFEAFQRGDLRLKDFVGHTDSPTWGRKVHVVSGRQAMAKAGVVPPKPASPADKNLPAAQRIPKNGFASQFEAERFYRDMNVDLVTNGPFDPAVATKVTRMLAKEYDRGNPIPPRVIFTEHSHGGALAYATANFHDMKQSTLTFISPKMGDAEFKNLKYQNDLSIDLFGRPWAFGTLDAEGVFTHEYAHYLHFQNITSVDRRGNQIWYDFDDGAGRTGTAGWSGWHGRGSKRNQAIAEKVTRYGASQPVEFVAEVYTGHARGEVFDRDVLDLYERLGGPTLRKDEP